MGRGRSGTGGYQFSQVPTVQIPRATFNRSHSHKTTFDSGYLVPVFVDEALPGDTLQVNLSAFARLATPLFPIMDNLFLDWFFFAVPNRLVWTNWERFMGAQPDGPDDSTDYLVPQVVTAGGVGEAELSIYDYMGIPTKVGGLSISALPLRAYNLIWNEWFRDQNLQDAVIVPKNDGPDGSTAYTLLKRGKRHDYFTSSLPWPQKGPGVELPLGTSAPVIGKPGGPAYPQLVIGSGANGGSLVADTSSTVTNVSVQNPSGYAGGALAWKEPNLIADLSQATAATINSLREAFQLQRLLERDARGGTRYVEILKAHFGVTAPDFRLQRPEFLGGGVIPVLVNPVAQTSGTPADLDTGYTNKPQGNLAAYGVAGSSGIGFSKAFVEHSVIIGLVMVRADLSYQQGLNRMWSRRTRYDFYWPVLSHLGEQEVLLKELYATGTATDDEVWGYQERWAEYRYKPSLITGRFRSNATASLDTWHLAQEFATKPTLSPEFIEEAPPVKRVIAVQTEPEFLLDCHFTVKSTRPMPVYSVPGLIDHF